MYWATPGFRPASLSASAVPYHPDTVNDHFDVHLSIDVQELSNKIHWRVRTQHLSSDVPHHAWSLVAHITIIVTTTPKHAYHVLGNPVLRRSMPPSPMYHERHPIDTAEIRDHTVFTVMVTCRPYWAFQTARLSLREVQSPSGDLAPRE